MLYRLSYTPDDVLDTGSGREAAHDTVKASNDKRGAPQTPSVPIRSRRWPASRAAVVSG